MTLHRTPEQPPDEPDDTESLPDDDSSTACDSRPIYMAASADTDDEEDLIQQIPRPDSTSYRRKRNRGMIAVNFRGELACTIKRTSL